MTFKLGCFIFTLIGPVFILLSLVLLLFYLPLWLNPTYHFLFPTSQEVTLKANLAHQVIHLLLKPHPDFSSVNYDSITFNSREMIHLADVHSLLSSSRLVWFTSFILLASTLILLKLGSHFLTLLSLAGRSSLTFILILGFLAFVGWDLWFETFHRLLFPPDSYYFYSTDLLIILFPPIFWNLITQLIIILDALISLTLIFVPQLYAFATKKRLQTTNSMLV